VRLDERERTVAPRRGAQRLQRRVRSGRGNVHEPGIQGRQGFEYRRLAAGPGELAANESRSGRGVGTRRALPSAPGAPGW